MAAMRCPIKAANQLSRDGKQATSLQGHCLQTHRDRTDPDWSPRDPMGSLMELGVRPGSPLSQPFTCVRAARLVVLTHAPHTPHVAHRRPCSVNAWRMGKWTTEAKRPACISHVVPRKLSRGGPLQSRLPPQSAEPHHALRRLPPRHFWGSIPVVSQGGS